jgi:predicted dehydrogenase
VEFENGVVVNIQHSWVVPPRFNEEYTRLIGVKGGIDFNAGVINYRKENGEKGEPKPDVKITSGGKSESTVLAMQAFLKSVKERSKPIATVENGRDAVLCCLLMRKAVETKEVATMERLKAERARS